MSCSNDLSIFSFLVLQLFLSSPRPTLRFAAVRTLNKVAIMQPQSVMTCNLDLENLITDVNRSIATLAITTLLKVGDFVFISTLNKAGVNTNDMKMYFLFPEKFAPCLMLSNKQLNCLLVVMISYLHTNFRLFQNKMHTKFMLFSHFSTFCLSLHRAFSL